MKYLHPESRKVFLQKHLAISQIQKKSLSFGLFVSIEEHVTLLREKCSYSELLWLLFSRTRTSVSLYSVRLC